MPLNYRPQPIDTSKIELDPSLVELTEYLSRNTHEVWSRRRMSQGWTYGPERNDAQRRHPDLIPYDDLSDADKQVDRDSAMETLRLILALGWRVEPPEGHQSGDQIGGISGGDASKLSLGGVVGLWQLWEQGKVQGWLEDYRRLGARALELGEFLLAFDILKHGLARWPTDVRLRQLQARALASSGAADTALQILRDLRREGHQDEETLGLLARTYKDLWERSTRPTRRTRYLALACAVYQKAYTLHGGYWTGINAATLAYCLGDTARSADLARAVRQECLSLLKASDNDYWLLATLGEAELVLGGRDEAAHYYGRAVKAAGQKLGSIASTRRNARLILRQAASIGGGASATLGAPEAADLQLERLLPLPRVVVFTGHMIDLPGRAAPRFPQELEAQVSSEIRKRLDDLGAGFGYASAACGSDILFHEAMLARGGETNIVLPYEVDRFIADSVCRTRSSEPNDDLLSSWEERFHKLLAHPQARLTIASQGRVEGGGIANEYANSFTFGLAGIRAWQLGAELAALAVWDGHRGDGPGGTADAVAQWRARGLRPTIIDLSGMVAASRGEPGAGDVTPAHSTDAGDVVGAETLTPPAASREGALSGRLMALLFADVSGFSKLTEEEIPLFVEHFLEPVARLIARSPHRPVQRNTWGDGLYFVFEDVTSAGLFALELRDLVTGTDWLSKGFQRNLSLRTGLHVGPVYACVNPVTGQRDYIGTHVSRAARIEPVTPKGHVYASEVFAAISFAQGASGFVCEYVGRMGMAKGYGVYPTYHVRRAGRQAREKAAKEKSGAGT